MSSAPQLLTEELTRLSCAELLSFFHRLDVELWAEAGRLAFNAPEGVLTAERKAALVARKADLLEFLQGIGSETGLPAIERLEHDGPFPASFAQERMWFLHQLASSSAAYNLPVISRLEGILDRAALSAAFCDLVARQAALRTGFEQRNGQLLQVVAPEPLELVLPCVDLTGLAEETRFDEARRLTSRESLRRFDLTRQGLWRAFLIRISDRNHEFFLNLHHIISDGWSMDIVRRELLAFYGDYARAKRPRATPLPVRYIDYASWQKRWLQDEVLARLLEFWRVELDPPSPALEWPLDRPRAFDDRGVGKHGSFHLPPSVSRALASLREQHDATPFMLTLGAFQALLARRTGQRDLSVGTPVAGRRLGEVEALVGLFVNTLVMRVDLRAVKSFRQLILEVRRRTLAAFDHQDLPFEKLVEALKPSRALGHTPFFQAFFAFQNTPRSRVDLPNLTWMTRLAESGSGFDLSLHLEPRGNHLRGIFAYRASLFDRATIQRLGRQFHTLLAAALEDPDRPLEQLALLTAGERHQLVVEWNDSAKSYAQASLPELMERQVDQHPDAVALIFADERLSYGRLDLAANRLARHLCRLGVVDEDRIGVLMERPVWRVISILAILKAGAAYVPIDPALPAKRRQLMVDDGLSDPPILLVDTPAQEDITASSSEGVRQIRVDRRFREDRSRLERAIHLDQAAYVIYTSGSTGHPKGVVNSHRGVVNRLLWARHDFGCGPDERWLAKASFSFDISLYEMLTPLLSGATLLLARPGGQGDPDYLARTIARHRITFIHFSPSMLRVFLNGPLAELKSLRRLQTGGEALPPDLLARCREVLPWVAYHNLYGPTEAAINVSWWPDADRRANLGSVPIGQPIANCHLFLFDRHLRPLPLGVPGEIYLGGVQISRGYNRRPSATARAFLPNPFSDQLGSRLYRSGDLGRYLANGEIEFLGRSDFQVKLRGFRIELGEIEAVLQQVEGVREAVVVLEDGVSGRPAGLVACWVGDEAPDLESRLLSHLEASLPTYMVPRSFVSLQALPITSNGKIDRHMLHQCIREQLADRSSSLSELDAPRNATEEMLCQAMAEVLGRDQVGRDEDFFELGGHSLLATQVVSRLRTALGRDLPLADFFAAPTASRLAERLRQGSVTAMQLLDLVRSPTDITARAPDRAPLSFAQERLWFLHRLAPKSAAYNMPFHLEWRGPLRPDDLKAALRTSIERHEALRTTFVERDGTLQQIVRPAASSLAWTAIDFSYLSEGRAESAALGQLEAEAGRPFDLRRGPLARMVLARIAEERFLLLINLHHIISDGWSMKLLTREVLMRYRSRGEKTAVDLAPPALRYVDYAIAQRRWLQGEVLARQLDFWRDRLSDQPPVAEWPLDRPRGALRSGRSARLHRSLDHRTSDRLARLARQRSATSFMALCALCTALLGRWSGQKKLVLGTPIAGRHHHGVEGVVGLFVNTLALPFHLAEDPSFGELLERTRCLALDAYEHQDLPFEKLVEQLRPERQLGAQPFFQAMVAFQNEDQKRPELPGVELISRLIASGEVKFDLDFSFFARRNRREWQIAYSLEYSTDLFDRTTLLRLTRHMECLLRTALEDPDRPLQNLPWLDAAERHQFVRECNPPYEMASGPEFIPDLIERRAIERPDAIGLIGAPSRHLSAGMLDRRADRLARYLLDLGAGPEEIVGHFFDRSLEGVLALVAILKTGSAYLPLDPALPDERLERMVSDAAPLAILTRSGLSERLRTKSIPLVRLEEAEASWRWQRIERIERSLSGEGLAYMIYTSGSTGEPKGVQISHRAMSRFLATARRLLGLDRSLLMLQFASLGFDTSVEEIFATLASGGTLVLRPPTMLDSIDAFLASCERYRLSLVHLPTAFWHEWMAALARRSRAFPRALETVVIGGEQASMTAWRTWFGQSHRPLLVNSYGPTEATVAVTEHRLPAPVERDAIVPIGRAVEGTAIFILGPRLELLPIGVPGEMFLAGEQLARGYRGRCGETAWRFLPSPFAESPGQRLYRTGDLARLRGDGGVEVLGRLDHQVKIRGFRIELGEIETALAEHPGVRFAVVMARTGINVTLCVYLVKEDPAIDRETLLAYSTSRLPTYMIPSQWVFLKSLPMTSTGKVDRRALPEPGDVNSRAVIPPRDRLEFELGGIFAEVLGLDGASKIDVGADFFELGGHSLLALRLLGRLEERLGRKLPLSVLFQHSTVERLADLLREDTLRLDNPSLSGKHVDSADFLVPMQRVDGESTPLFVVHPIGGEVMAYLHLVPRLPRPVYGLAAPAGDCETQIEKMAERYVEAILTARLIGPRLLAGWSLGGLIAYEMARRLDALEPGSVEQVFMIDSWGFESPTGLRGRMDGAPVLGHRLLVESFARNLASSWNLNIEAYDLDALGEVSTAQDALRRLHAQAIIAGEFPKGVGFSQIERLFNSFRHHFQAAQHYRPPAWPGKVVLFRADAWPERSICKENERWRELSGDFSWVSLSGDHFTLLRPPRVEDLAEHIEDRIKLRRSEEER